MQNIRYVLSGKRIGESNGHAETETNTAERVSIHFHIRRSVKFPVDLMISASCFGKWQEQEKLF
jgi:hypothetical protein